MSYSKFGEFMRILRIKHHEIMGDTARLLKISVDIPSMKKKSQIHTNF